MKKRITAVFAILLGCILLFGNTVSYALLKSDTEVIEEEPLPATVEGEEDAAGFVILDYHDQVSFHTALQKRVLEAGYENVLNICRGTEENSLPRGVILSWIFNGEGGSGSFRICIGQQEDLTDAASFETNKAPNENGVYHYAVQNLFLNTTYYYTISTDIEGQEATSAIHSFTTDSDAPRNMFVEGVTNVRDLGGWTTLDGKRIRQGLIYRCGQLNTEKTQDACITQAGIETMRQVMHIKTEIDLRRNETMDNENGGITSSFLGEDVAYINIPMAAANNPEDVKVFFDLLSDVNNYPIIYHCKIGTDRTGSLTYLILGILGVSMDDIYTEYIFSNTGNIHGLRAHDKLDSSIEAYAEPGGETVQESCINYLLSCGITQEQIDTITGLLLE